MVVLSKVALGQVIWIGPVTALVGTVAVIFVAVLVPMTPWSQVLLGPLNDTAVAPERPVPVMVMTLPGFALAVKFVGSMVVI